MKPFSATGQRRGARGARDNNAGILQKATTRNIDFAAQLAEIFKGFLINCHWILLSNIPQRIPSMRFFSLSKSLSTPPMMSCFGDKFSAAER